MTRQQRVYLRSRNLGFVEQIINRVKQEVIEFTVIFSLMFAFASITLMLYYR